MKINEQAKGHWLEILIGFGVNPELLTGKHCGCPLNGCGGKDRFRFDDKWGCGNYICNQCGAGNGFDIIKDLFKCEFPEAAQRVEGFLNGSGKRQPVRKKEPEELNRDKKAGNYIESLLKMSKPLGPGDPVCEYLKGRGLNGAPPTLLCAPKLWDTGTKKAYPGMVAKIHSPTGEVIALHRTFLENGKKAEIDAPRKITTPITTINGGAIRLWPADETVLAVAEGIETALAVRVMFPDSIPVWAVLNANGMKTFQPPEEIKSVGIYADNDKNGIGQLAAFNLMARLIKEGISATVYIPKMPGHDWLDELNNDR